MKPRSVCGYGYPPVQVQRRRLEQEYFPRRSSGHSHQLAGGMHLHAAGVHARFIAIEQLACGSGHRMQAVGLTA
jgi:hypothetical protein